MIAGPRSRRASRAHARPVQHDAPRDAVGLHLHHRLTLSIIAIWGIERRYIEEGEASPQSRRLLYGGDPRCAGRARGAADDGFRLHLHARRSARRSFCLSRSPARCSPSRRAKPHSFSVCIAAASCSAWLLGAIVGSLSRRNQTAGRYWVAAGCFASAIGLFRWRRSGLAAPVSCKLVVFSLGAANGVYAVAAIGTMISLASVGKGAREGVRMGLWGAAQAIAFGFGGVIGTAAVDVARYGLGSPSAAYSLSFRHAGRAFHFRLGSRHQADRGCRAGGARPGH